MARSEIAIVDLSQAAFTLQGAGDAIDATNHHVLTPGNGPVEDIVLHVYHTTASEKDITIVAGDSPPAVAAGQGDIVEAFAAGDSTPVQKMIVVESGRFMQSDGTIHIDIESAMTGTIFAYRIPKGR